MQTYYLLNFRSVTVKTSDEFIPYLFLRTSEGKEQAKVFGLNAIVLICEYVYGLPRDIHALLWDGIVYESPLPMLSGDKDLSLVSFMMLRETS